MAKKKNLEKSIELINQKISIQEDKIKRENEILQSLLQEKDRLETEHYNNQFEEIVNNARANNMSIEDIKAIVLGNNTKKKQA